MGSILSSSTAIVLSVLVLLPVRQPWNAVIPGRIVRPGIAYV